MILKKRTVRGGEMGCMNSLHELWKKNDKCYLNIRGDELWIESESYLEDLPRGKKQAGGTKRFLDGRT